MILMDHLIHCFSVSFFKYHRTFSTLFPPISFERFTRYYLTFICFGSISGIGVFGTGWFQLQGARYIQIMALPREYLEYHINVVHLGVTNHVKLAIVFVYTLTSRGSNHPLGQTLAIINSLYCDDLFFFFGLVGETRFYL